MKNRQVFRLQKVLEVRQIVEKEKQKELALAVSQLLVAENELSQLLDKKSNFVSEMSRLRSGSAHTFSGRHHYLVTLTREIDRQRQIAVKKEKDVEAKRRLLLKATQEKKTLEKLKEKKQEAMQRLQSLAEQQFMDDIAMRKKTY